MNFKRGTYLNVNISSSPSANHIRGDAVVGAPMLLLYRIKLEDVPLNNLAIHFEN
jgi:hypothetical protein